MKSRHLISLLQTGYTTIRVVFQNERDRVVPSTGRVYTYKTKKLDTQVGQTVVVRVSGKYALAQIVEVHDTPRIDVDADFDYKWVVQVVDPTEYNTIREAEAIFAETLQNVEKLKQQEQLLEDFRKHLPTDSTARLMFDQAVKNFEASSEQKSTTQV